MHTCDDQTGNLNICIIDLENLGTTGRGEIPVLGTSLTFFTRFSIITGSEKFTIIKEFKLRFYATSVSLERFH